ncbi:rhodanese-like domain-containing protein [Aliifodinibius salipaludis]|nr:rhodanese-like domain-containing protein [Aliifodinibius salipaludis]
MKRLFILGLVAVMTLFVGQACAQTEADNTRISAEQFQEKVDETPGVVIDVRTQEEYNQGHLAMVDDHLDLLNGDFEASLDSLNKEKTYYLYCRTGNRSGQAVELMKENGFKNVYNIGGFQDLVNAGIESSK